MRDINYQQKHDLILSKKIKIDFDYSELHAVEQEHLTLPKAPVLPRVKVFVLFSV